MKYEKELEREKKARQRLIDCYYSDAEIYELKREISRYFKKANAIWNKLEKE